MNNIIKKKLAGDFLNIMDSCVSMMDSCVNDFFSLQTAATNCSHAVIPTNEQSCKSGVFSKP